TARLQSLPTHYIVIHGWAWLHAAPCQKKHPVLAAVRPAERAENGSTHIDRHIEPLQRRTDKPKATVEKYGRQKEGDENCTIGIDGPVLRPDDRLFATPGCLCHCLISFLRPGFFQPARASPRRFGPAIYR